MAELFNVTMDAGNLDEFDGTTTDGGQFSAEVGAALGGSTEGGQFVIDDTNELRGYMGPVASGNYYRVRMYLDPNGLDMANGDLFNIHWSSQSGGASLGIVNIRLYYDGSNYRLSPVANNDANEWPVSVIETITDAEHYVEVNFVRASSAIASDGTFQWWIDGVDQGTTEDIDNYNLLGDQNWYSQFGANGLDVGTTGTLYLDEFVLNNDGSEIGAAGAPAAGQPTSLRATTVPGMRQWHPRIGP